MTTPWPAQGPDLAAVTRADFEARSDRPVRLQGPGVTIALEIAEVAPMGMARREGGAFSVLFRGPAAPLLPQAIHRVEIDGEAPFELFLVPVGPDAAGQLYQAVFT